MTATTPIYGLHYLVPGEPARNTRAALEANAFAIEAALASHALAPPAAADLAAVTGRVSVLEGLVAPGTWTTLPLAGTATTLNHDTPNPVCQYRVENKRVYLRGWAKAGTSGVTAGVLLWSTLPAALRPSVTETTWPVRGTTLGVFRMDVQAADGRGVFTVNLPANEYVNLNTVHWPLP